MDGSFIEALAQEMRSPEVLKVDGREYLVTPRTDGDHEVVGLEQPEATVAPLELRTLSGLCAYLTENRDGLALTSLVLHVVGPQEVVLRSALKPLFGQRHVYARATAETIIGTGLRYGSPYDQETFVIALQTCCAPTEHLAPLLALVGHVTAGAERTLADDGITQTVSVKAGVHLKREAAVPNPVVLAPYRTFREVAQPASPFLLRVQRGDEDTPPTFSLHEADGGAWQLEAIETVAAYLRAHAPEAVAVLA